MTQLKATPEAFAVREALIDFFKSDPMAHGGHLVQKNLPIGRMNPGRVDRVVGKFLELKLEGLAGVKPGQSIGIHHNISPMSDFAVIKNNEHGLTVVATPDAWKKMKEFSVKTLEAEMQALREQLSPPDIRAAGAVATAAPQPQQHVTNG